jgi:hypothetical protein
MMLAKWEVRIVGPDEVLTFDNEIEAHRYAKVINDVAAWANAPLRMEDRVMLHATVHRVELAAEGER